MKKNKNSKTNAIQEKVFDQYLEATNFPKLDNISKKFGEQLFKLWVTGTSFLELIEMYDGTPYQFDFNQIQNLYHSTRWEEKKQTILNGVYETLRVQTLIAKADKIKVFNKINSLVIHEIEDEYSEYLSSGKKLEKRPKWMPNNQKELEIWFKLHDFIVSGGHELKQKADLTINNVSGDQGVDDLNDEQLTMFLKALCENKINYDNNLNLIEVKKVEINE